MVIRPAADDDVPGCIDLWADALVDRDGQSAEQRARARAASKFEAERVAFIVAMDDGADLPSGFALVAVPGSGETSDPSDAAYLSLIAVRPGRQGEGIGSALLDAVRDAVCDAGFGRCVLHALHDNDRAVRLYRRHGWAPVGGTFPHPQTGAQTQTYVWEAMTSRSAAAH